MRRRAFLGCGVVTALATAGCWPEAAAAPEEVQAMPGPRAQLLLEGKVPLRARDVVPHKTYVFLYPFEGTPCFLLNLGRAVLGGPVSLDRVGLAYTWPGGAGPDRSIVAYSAICPHAYTHPTRDGAMIHYYGPDGRATVAQRANVVTCCVHGSAFDPGSGAVPLQPPAEVPLAAVLLEWDEPTDALYARAVVGRLVFDEFFRSFPASGRGRVQGVTPVWALERYSRTVFAC